MNVLFALLFVLIGGLILALVDHFAGDKPPDEAAEIRTELRVEIKTMKADIERIETEVEAWKKGYYDLLKKMINLGCDINELDK